MIVLIWTIGIELEKRAFVIDLLNASYQIYLVFKKSREEKVIMKLMLIIEKSNKKIIIIKKWEIYMIDIMSDAAKALINKVSNVTGVLLYPVESRTKTISDGKNALIKLQSEYDIIFKKDILDNREMSDFTRAALISNLTMSTKEFINQVNILDVAIKNIKKTANPENLDDDWLFFFMHKASYVTDEQLKKTWGRILAEACDEPTLCSKTLVNSLSLINKKQAEMFINVCKFRFVDMDIPVDERNAISKFPVIFLNKTKGYSIHGITYKGITELSQLGLISIDSNKEFVVYADKLKLRDNRSSVEIIAKDKIEIGNVIFTHDGFLLQKIIENYYDSKIMDYNIHIWCKKGYEVYRNGKKQRGEL